MSTTLEPGEIAPDFILKDSNGNIVSLKGLRGRKVALYFYPKDDTPGCTKEACSVRDSWKQLREVGIVVLGVSPDSEESHREFAEKYKLPHTLLTDTQSKVAKEYGVWGEKNMYGKKYIGILRTTFLIDEDGVIKQVIKKPDVENHAEEIMFAFG